ncbi:MAG TPA: type 4a pilus biogenesis protein PilO [Pyrinomonadaceae bacterium]|jgi:Tfp pilus assembly protein PilO|nr:type 4a pilus biogenesis protein PilO [Pyrinomonadaceae bacterium]
MNKLKNLAIHWQLLIMVGVAVLLYGGFYYMVTSGIREETKQLEDQVAALRQKNEAARIATQRIDEFRALALAKTAEYDELKVLLPEQREITNVLQGLQDTAQVSRMTLLRFSPKDDVQQGFITAKAVEVEVASNFNNLRAFYEKMARMARIVSISDFRISQRPKQSSDKTLDSQFVLTAYYATPESVLKQQELESAAKNPKPGAPPAAPGAASPAAPAAPAPAH